jgi:hypothetical protein
MRNIHKKILNLTPFYLDLCWGAADLAFFRVNINYSPRNEWKIFTYSQNFLIYSQKAIYSRNELLYSQKSLFYSQTILVDTNQPHSKGK